jgi:hypothetical protein
MNHRFGLTLSSLDLMTCGFGGVTLVFLILLAIQGKITDDAADAAPGEGVAASSPFVLTIEVESPEPAWSLSGDGPWPADKPSARDPSAPRLGFGPRQAIYAAPSPPPPGTVIRFGPVARDARFRIRVVKGGQSVVREHQTAAGWAPSRDGILTLWPSELDGRPGPRGAR